MFTRVRKELAGTTNGLVPRWSYSAYSTFKRCPKCYYFGYVKKIKQAPFYAMERGTTIHALAENYLIGKITGLPKALAKLRRELAGLKAYKPTCEKYWGVTPRWKKAEYGWLVAKTDAFVIVKRKGRLILVVVDHKTGGIYPEHVDQASLYASVGYAIFPHVDSVEVEFFYLDKGEVHNYTYTKAKLRANIKHWMAEGRRLMTQTKFPATPSKGACGFCGYRTDKKLADGSPGLCDKWKLAS